MTQIQTFQNSSFNVQCVCVNGDPWFRGKDVATMLGYADTKKAIANNVDPDYKKRLEALRGEREPPWTQTQKMQYSLTSQVSTL